MPYYRLVGDALAYAIPNASRVVIKNGGHRANASQPAAFNSAILEFLNKLASEASVLGEDHLVDGVRYRPKASIS
jgi:hypothetical protein